MHEGERKSFLGQVGLTLLGLTLVSAEEFGKAVGKLVEEGKLAASDAERLIKDAMGGGTSRLEQVGATLSDALRKQFERACSRAPGEPGPFGEAAWRGGQAGSGGAQAAKPSEAAAPQEPREASAPEAAPEAGGLAARLAAVEARLAALEAKLAADRTAAQTDAEAQGKEDY